MKLALVPGLVGGERDGQGPVKGRERPWAAKGGWVGFGAKGEGGVLEDLGTPGREQDWVWAAEFEGSLG